MHEQEEAGDDLRRKVIPRSEGRKRRREEKERGGTGGEERKRGEFSLRKLGEKRDSLAGCLGGRIAVRFLAHLAVEGYLRYVYCVFFVSF